jgi:hypothetical protein
MKYAIGFLFGSVFSAFAVVLAGGRSAVMLWLGFAMAVALVSGILYLMGIRRTARFLSAFADAWGTKDEASRASAPAKLRRVKSDSDRWEEVLQEKRTPNARVERRAVRESEENAAFFADPELFEVPAKKGQVA